jgi:drug/metabolite transporter (DMT)-like permease
MHFGINILNNGAFAYNISVPVHIILRSFGSVTTMTAGVLRGKRYSKLQVLSVVVLTIGVLISAWADAQSKVGMIELGRVTLAYNAFRANLHPRNRKLRPQNLSMDSLCC